MAWLCVLDMLLCCRTRLTSGCVGTRAEKAGDCKLSSGRVAHTQDDECCGDDERSEEGALALDDIVRARGLAT